MEDTVRSPALLDPMDLTLEEWIEADYLNDCLDAIAQSLDTPQTALSEDNFSWTEASEEGASTWSQSERASSPPTPAGPTDMLSEYCPYPKTSAGAETAADLVPVWPRDDLAAPIGLMEQGGPANEAEDRREPSFTVNSQDPDCVLPEGTPYDETAREDSDESSDIRSSLETPALQRTTPGNPATDRIVFTGCPGDDGQGCASTTPLARPPDHQPPRAVVSINLMRDSICAGDTAAKTTGSAVCSAACAPIESSEKARDDQRLRAVEIIDLTEDSESTVEAHGSTTKILTNEQRLRAVDVIDLTGGLEPARASDTTAKVLDSKVPKDNTLSRDGHASGSAVSDDACTARSDDKRSLFDGSWHDSIDGSADKDLQRAIREDLSNRRYVSDDDSDYAPKKKRGKSKHGQGQRARQGIGVKRQSGKAQSRKRHSPGRSELEERIRLIQEAMRKSQEQVEALIRDVLFEGA